MRKQLNFGYLKTSDEREIAFGDFNKKEIKNERR